MTPEEKLATLKVLVEETNSDDELKTYLKIAESKILNRAFPYGADDKDVPEKYSMLQCEIAAYLWHKRGAEGQTSHSENAINRQYESGDVPDSLLGQIVPYVSIL